MAKLNALLIDADLMSVDQITQAIAAIKGNVPDVANTLERFITLSLP